MPRRCYRITPGTRITPTGDGRYELQAPERPVATLHPPAVAPLLLVDGQRGEAEIEHRMAADGNALPAGVLGGILSSLSQAGVLALHDSAWRPLETASWPEHRCQGCGACCQGHWIGPLDPGFVADTVPRLEALREKYPTLQGRKPFVRIDPNDPGLFLNSESGQCVFLDEHLSCILHAEYGAEGKPSICRMFPHVRFEDDHRTRLGQGVMCLTHLDQLFDDDAPADDDYWHQLNEQIDGGLYHYYPATNQSELEEEIIAALPDAEDPIRFVLQQVTPRRAMRPGRHDSARRVDMLTTGCLERVEAELARDELMTGLRDRSGEFPEHIRSIRALAVAGSKGTPRKPRVPHVRRAKQGPIGGLLRDVAFRYLFLRQYLMFMGLQHGTAGLLIGVWCGLALTADEADETAAAKRFGRVLTTWLRICQAPAVRRTMFQGPDQVERFLAAFYTFWKSR